MSLVLVEVDELVFLKVFSYFINSFSYSYFVMSCVVKLYDIVLFFIIRAPITATWADRFSWCCWQRFSRFFTCPI